MICPSEDSLRHYEVGVRIGDLHGCGLCLWRLGRADEAAGVFERMLWLNPGDNKGVWLLLPEVRAGERWEDRRAKD